MWQKAVLDFEENNGLIDLILSPNQVHIWLLNLEENLFQLNKLKSILSPDEQIKANKFRFPIHQNRFIIARANLRLILSKYLVVKPQAIEFSYSEKGKPSLAKHLNQQLIEFNLSHSENLALYGFTLKNKIGVDIEKIKENSDTDGIAKRFFTNNEYQIISQLSGKEKHKTFFKFWTSKEAYLKAIGEGLTGGLNNVEIKIKNQQIKLNTPNKSKQVISNWQLKQIDIEKDYIATIAVENKQRDINYRFYTNSLNLTYN